MAVAIEQVLERLRDRAETDSELAETLGFLAGQEDDPFASLSPGIAAAARAVNARRQAARRDQLAHHCLTTAQVVKLVGSISDRRAVDRRRHRGSLLGVTVGNTTLHPSWQFDEARGDTRPGLAQVITALGGVTGDPRGADELMVAPRRDLAGRSIAEIFADGKIELAVTLIRMAGDQS